MSTHGHREIEAIKLKMLNVFKLRILNLMWLPSFRFKCPLLHHDSFLRTWVFGSSKTLVIKQFTELLHLPAKMWQLTYCMLFEHFLKK